MSNLTLVEKIKRDIRKVEMEKNKNCITNYNLTDFGIAEMFEHFYSEGIKWVVDDNCFYVWNKKLGIWVKDISKKTEHKVEMFLSHDIYDLIEGVKQDKTRKRYLEYFKMHQRNKDVAAIIACLKRNPKMQLYMDSFDSKPRYFNTKNCVVNLDDFSVMAHDKSLFLSKRANFKVLEGVLDHTWKRFLMDVADSDIHLYEYLLRMIYYAIQGTANSDCMFLLLGEKTRNGKSTLVNSLKVALGDYSIAVQPDLLLKGSKNNGGPRPDIARLYGRRYITIAEADLRQKIDSSILKSITGGDIITSRNLYSNDYNEFRNSGVIFLHSNSMPLIEDNSIIKSHRIINVPFDVQFDKDTIDVNMEKKLTQEKALAGLFNEVKRIAKKYEGISIKENLPLKVQKATMELENNCDVIGWFTNECLERDKNSKILSSMLYKQFDEWRIKNHLDYISQKEFSLSMKKRGYIIKHGNLGNYFLGLKEN